jgi:hypothetical protein
VQALWAMVEGVLRHPRFRRNVIARRRDFAADAGEIQSMLDLAAGWLELRPKLGLDPAATAAGDGTARAALEKYTALLEQARAAASAHAFPYPSLFVLDSEDFLRLLRGARRAVALLAPALGAACAERMAAACAAAEDEAASAPAGRMGWASRELLRDPSRPPEPGEPGDFGHRHCKQPTSERNDGRTRMADKPGKREASAGGGRRASSREVEAQAPRRPQPQQEPRCGRARAPARERASDTRPLLLSSLRVAN